MVAVQVAAQLVTGGPQALGQAAAAWGFPPFPADAPAGSWRCDACANVNWPRRATCNARTCGLPRGPFAPTKPPGV